MRALTYFNTLQKPVNIKASASLIIHIWPKYTLCACRRTIVRYCYAPTGSDSGYNIICCLGSLPTSMHVSPKVVHWRGGVGVGEG